MDLKNLEDVRSLCAEGEFTEPKNSQILKLVSDAEALWAINNELKDFHEKSIEKTKCDEKSMHMMSQDIANISNDLKTEKDKGRKLRAKAGKYYQTIRTLSEIIAENTI